MMAQIPLFLAMSVGELLSFVLSFVVASAIAFGIIAGVTSYLRFQFLTQPVADSDEDEKTSDDTFQLQVLQRMGTGTKTPDPFGLAMIRFPEAQDEEGLEGVVNILKENLRQEDIIHVSEEGYIALLLGTAGARVDNVMKRIVALPNLKKAVPGLKASLVCFPENGSHYKDLLDLTQEGFSVLAESSDVLYMAPRENDIEEQVLDQSDMLDALTGVLKPERLVGALQKYVARHRKEATPVSLLYIDVDYLDRYNRHYGREGGDAVLNQLGAMIESRFRETDLVGRYEGEEFLIALGCRAHRALIGAQRFVADVKKHPFEFGNTKLKITVSAGVAGFPEHGNVPRELFDAASAALLAAKNRGRGSAVMYEKGMPSPADLEKNVERI